MSGAWLQEKGILVIMISGNHDSPERVAFVDSILDKQGLYIAGNYKEPLKTVVLEDEYGPVHFVCMPFVKPAVTGSSTNAEAVEHMLSMLPMTLSMRQRYVLLTHYFVMGEQGELPELSDSETDVNVGGLDSVSVSLFQNFCYVALGHIHKPQQIGKLPHANIPKHIHAIGEIHKPQLYYSGSPLKYSFSEARGEKSVNIVELNETGVEKVTRYPLKPLREMRCIKGRLEDLMRQDVIAENADCLEDYIQVTLTDEEELIDPIGTLRSVYPNVLQLLLEKHMVGEERGYESSIGFEKKSTAELFGEFYEMLKGEPLDERRKQVVWEAAEEAERALQ